MGVDTPVETRKDLRSYTGGRGRIDGPVSRTFRERIRRGTYRGYTDGKSSGTHYCWSRTSVRLGGRDRRDEGVDNGVGSQKETARRTSVGKRRSGQQE